MTIDKSQVARQFSRSAASYDAYARIQNSMAQRLTELLEPNSGRLIDLGCGTGRALMALSQDDRHSCTELFGVDIAAGMIEVAKRQTDAFLVCCDIESTPFENDMFDIAYSNTALQWCDLDSVAKEVDRLLVPNGQFVFSTFGPRTLEQWKTALKTIDPDVERIHQFHGQHTIRKVLEQNGFGNIKIEVKLHFESFATIKEMLKSVRKIGATYADLNRERTYFGREKYRTLINRMEEIRGSLSKFQLTYESIFVSCRSAG